MYTYIDDFHYYNELNVAWKPPVQQRSKLISRSTANFKRYCLNRGENMPLSYLSEMSYAHLSMIFTIKTTWVSSKRHWSSKGKDSSLDLPPDMLQGGQLGQPIKWRTPRHTLSHSLNRSRLTGHSGGADLPPNAGVDSQARPEPLESETVWCSDESVGARRSGNVGEAS